MSEDESGGSTYDDDLLDEEDEGELYLLASLELRAGSSAALLVRTGTIVRVLGYLVAAGTVLVGVLSLTQAGQFGDSLPWAYLSTFLVGLAYGAVLVLVGTYAEMRGLRAQADDSRRRLAREL